MTITIFTNMINDDYYVIGVMSGTSLDGIDLVYVKFSNAISWEYEIIYCKTIPYSEDWRIILSGLTGTKTFDKINRNYTKYLASIINQFMKETKIGQLDFISSHGHTALHQPEQGVSLQLGNLPELSNYLGCQVICDFRTDDVRLGGQGAPLVPIGDHYLFAEYDYCVNLGGFANLSTIVDNERIAYDICPVNIVLNYYTNKLGLKFDDKGQLASKGLHNPELFSDLNKLDYYDRPYPKSLGLEWVEAHVIPLIDSYQLPINDILRTFVEHCAFQISCAFKDQNQLSALVTGGGVYNDFLIRLINQYSRLQIIIPVNEIIEFKEALVFAFLGVLKSRNEINCLRSVTGASIDHSSGKIFLP